MKNLLEQMQILPPWNDDVKFENFITSYFNDLENSFSFDRFGRLGQKQYGLDIYSSEKKTVIQCKLKLIRGGNDERIRKELIEELDTDFKNFIAYNKANNLNYTKFIFASTFYSDTHIATECSKRSNDSIVVEYWGWDKIQNNLPEKVFKTYYSEFLSFIEEFYYKDTLPYINNTEYIQDTNTIDFILRDEKPSKNQANFVTKLINSDNDYRRYFYAKVENPNWFYILSDKGEFDPTNNLKAIQIKGGYQIPRWESLFFLIKISIQIKNGNSHELIEDILKIIEKVSKEPKDNYSTWNFILKILSNIPNEHVPINLLNFIPIWLNGAFDTMLQTSEICDKLLPKFLNDYPSKDDIQKAELILKHLISLEIGEFTDSEDLDNKVSYRSRIYMHSLKDALTNKVILEKITSYCSSEIIVDLAENIKKLRFDFIDGIKVIIKTEVDEIELKTEISASDLLVTIKNKTDTSKPIIANSKFLNYEQLNRKETYELYIKFLRENKITFIDTDDNKFNFDILLNALFNGSYVTFPDSFISKLDDRYHHGESPNEIFSLIFRDLLNQYAKSNFEETNRLVRLFAFNNKYRLPFFQRVILYVISENWNLLKELFLEILSSDDPKRLFSDYNYQNELYELLNKNQHLINDVELEVIQTILELGPSEDDRERDESYNDYWRLRWYSALRTIPKYTELYSILSKKFGRTHDDFDSENQIRFTSGDRSPLTPEEILDLPNSEIAKYINSFKPKDKWEEPTISGFSSMLGKAIEINPLKFSEEIEIYKDVYFIYAYHIANGFKDTWKNGNPLNWEKVLQYFLNYLKDERFKNNQFALENDGWNATSGWAVGAIANLLSAGMQSDDNAFDKELLPIAKEILQNLIQHLEPQDNIKETNMDYPTYSVNSTSGKILRSCVDYALRIGRNDFEKHQEVKWDIETKEFFDSAFQQNIIDTYILSGWYFQQFYFLDKKWICDKIKEFNTVEERNWLAFIGGFTFSNPPSNKTIYKLSYPHYERAINNNVNVKTRFDHSLIRHIAAFYFWGYEDLNTQGLLSLLIKNGNHNSILELVNFIWRQEKFVFSLSKVEDVKRVEKIILELWTLLSDKYKDAKSEDEQKVLVSLSNLLELAPELNENYTNLVLKSIEIPDKEFHSHYLIKNLIKKKDKGEPTYTAKYIGIILNTIQYKTYFSFTDNKDIIDLVEFLYLNKQKDLANQFCNKMVKKGHEFLKEIYNKHH